MVVVCPVCAVAVACSDAKQGDYGRACWLAWNNGCETPACLDFVEQELTYTPRDEWRRYRKQRREANRERRRHRYA